MTNRIPEAGQGPNEPVWLIETEPADTEAEWSEEGRGVKGETRDRHKTKERIVRGTDKATAKSGVMS